MKIVPVLLLACSAWACAPAARADAPPPKGFDPARHMRVAEVKVGMKGYGLSVFKGAKIERFEVEVLSVLKNFNPKDDVVLITCKGANLEHTGSIAGMSGSPVFLRDDQGRERMIGAFAYGWPLMKDAVAGVQPIEYMLAIPDAKEEQTAAAGGAGAKLPATQEATKRATWSLADAICFPGMAQPPARYPFAEWASMAPNPRLSGGHDDDKRLRPLATPMMAAGLPPKVLEQFGPVFGAYGIVPLQAGAAPATLPQDQVKPQLEPGSTLALPLLTGDMELTAIGTVTEVLGDRVYGFGHAFQNEGPVSLPMGTGYIHTVIANLTTSFKLGASVEPKGSICADQTVGIAGLLGKSATMVPVQFKVAYPASEQTYNFRAALHPRLTPLLVATAFNASATGQHEMPQYLTVDYDVALKFANGREIRVRNVTANISAPELFFEIAGPIMALVDNPFEKVPLKEVVGTLKVTPEAREAQVLSVNIPRSRYEPGESVSGFVNYRPFRGAEAIMPLSFDLPRDLPDGTYQLSVTDWQNYLTEEQQLRPFRFATQSIDDVFAGLQELSDVRHDAIYIRLMRKADGVAIGRAALPRLPSSRRQVLMGAGLSNVTAYVSSTVKTIPTAYVMNGSAQFAITIDRNGKGHPATAPAAP